MLYAAGLPARLDIKVAERLADRVPRLRRQFAMYPQMEIMQAHNASHVSAACHAIWGSANRKGE